jgi:hypothetical protein
MTDRTFIVRFKPRQLSTQPVIAADAEIHGEHIVLLNSTGKLAALFLMEVVESWTELPSCRNNLPQFTEDPTLQALRKITS